jgi:hypothetical protein
MRIRVPRAKPDIPQMGVCEEAKTWSAKLRRDCLDHISGINPHSRFITFTHFLIQLFDFLTRNEIL